uniref:Large ribosomal subunit protein eL34 n=3 Tax=Eukaryota TaxID=2759 RepID=A0A3B4XFB0_SERLL|mmetsp:Transcript_15289/g.45112  ORF Transcript_15289/g.45112 Transcript_15289/m.45112 type:complete len:118 (-) Transcript_15289:184-537(-)
MVQRVTYRRRKSFATKSNVVRKVRTPGGKLTLQYVGKQAKRTGCGESGCDRPLSGIKAHRPQELKRISKRQKTVSRPYGGAKCGKCVRTRIIRAFLIEEQKIVKKVLKAQTAEQPKK